MASSDARPQILELLWTARTQPKSWVAEIRDYCGLGASWGNLCPPSRSSCIAPWELCLTWNFGPLLLAQQVSLTPHYFLFSSSQGNSKWPSLPYLSAISRFLWTPVPSGPSLSVPWASSVSPGLSSCSSLLRCAPSSYSGTWASTARPARVPTRVFFPEDTLVLDGASSRRILPSGAYPSVRTCGLGLLSRFRCLLPVYYENYLKEATLSLIFAPLPVLYMIIWSWYVLLKYALSWLFIDYPL